MSQIGVTVTSTEAPPTPVTNWSTANAFMIGLADWGATGVATAVQNLAGVQVTVGPRSATNATLYDSADVFLREGGSNAYVARVVGPGASAASLTLLDSGGSATMTVAGQFVGTYGNNINIAVANTGGTSYVITVTDTYGNTLATSPALTTRAGAQTWAATTSYVTIAPRAGSTLPATLVATSMTGGTDDRGNVTLATYQNTLASAFAQALGPGQVCSPGITNTTVSGIWAALQTHAQARNRIPLYDIDDGIAASTAVSQVGTTFNAITGLGGFWAGWRSAPGVTPGTTRTIPPSAVLAGLCARVDSQGNPNRAAAGSYFPLRFCTGPTTLVSGSVDTYNVADRETLKAAGINTFDVRFNVPENYGFRSAITSATDPIFWELSAQRLRMALQADAQIIGEPFVFAQIDGQLSAVSQFGAALSSKLAQYYKAGALFGATQQDAFLVDVGPKVNTVASLQAGVLQAIVYVRMSPFAESVQIVLTAVPITQTIPVANPTVTI